jgi:hypothetical protein
MNALRFPDHFPPTDRWKKFFIGVRWLGPDLSFFKQLKAEQASRPASIMDVWAGGLRQEVASALSSVLAQQLGWRSGCFLPQDAVAVAFHGPRFDFNDPESAFEAAVEMFKEKFDIDPPDSFWRAHAEGDMGRLIDALVGSRDV